MGIMAYKAIDDQRWMIAQRAERKLHKLTLHEGIEHYRESYSHNFRYLCIDPDCNGKSIIEIGCADFPALRYCTNYSGLIVEPLPSEYLQQWCMENYVLLMAMKFEELADNFMDKCEIWMFNVLQHVQDPEKFIAKAKLADTIRYFEPIDTEITDYHPHSFTKEDFERWFPNGNRFYNETTHKNFHDGPCCYGVYKNCGC
jgi:hypothetical protein